jgi:HEPN domain-containing protein
MLCKLAREDESTLQFPLPDQIFGFHAQQSCEKLFKALIAANNQTYPFTHSLEKLGEILEDSQETLPDMPYDLIQLEPFAVQLRYDIGESVAEEDKVAIRESVAILRAHVINRILTLEGLLERDA